MTTNEPTPSGRVVDAVERHLALTASGLLVGYVVVKAYVFSGLDVPTMLAVLGAIDRPQVLVASAATLAATVLPAFYFSDPVQRTISRGNAPGASFVSKVVSALLVVPVATLVLPFLTPLTAIALTALIAAYIVAVASRLRAARRGDRASGQHTRRRGIGRDSAQWLMATSIGLILAVSLGQPWVPRERVVLKDTDPVVGYVIGERGSFTLLLTAMREPTWVKTSAIEGREVCAATRGGWWDTPLLDAVRRGPGLPECSAPRQ
ncbi:hypothetical protein [Xylanimonas protaetiae]|uniref:Uncharacterized protein n=1 Tax=Xylanimonas protaetiae TaxID=2509457 RepID=A0A4P6FAG5_9MICO|nr:hypothetical protein [Xylanimonas protaetiae]QAY70387.1 hypothetical protein ET471_10380 [Xylanimonas protaetiae]